MSDLSIQQERRTYDGVNPIEEAMPEMTKRYYEARPQRAVAPERADSMKKAKSWDTPVHWGDVLDGDAAVYLCRLVTLEGTQSRRDGFVSDSRENLRTGPKRLGKKYTDHKQRRIERDLTRLGLAEFRPGWHRETMGRPNMTFIKAWNHYGDYDEAVFAVLEGRFTDATESAAPDTESAAPDTESAASSYGKRTTGATESARLNTTPPYPSTTPLSPRAHAQPEREDEEREKKEEKDKGKVERCVEILSDINGIGNARFLARRVSNLAEKHPRVDPVEVCKSYRDFVASMDDPVGSHQALLDTHFKGLAKKVATEGPHPHGADAPVFRASDQEVHPRPKMDFREMQRLVDEHVPDEEVVRRATVAEVERTVA